MNFAQTQRNPVRNLTGIGLVILLHLLIGYALVTGLATKVVEIIKAPLEVKVIEEAVKPPPPPDLPPPPPKLLAPPPPFIPPPEVSIAPPPTPAPTITATVQEPPPAPVQMVPQAPVVVPAPPAPAPVARTAAVACPNLADVKAKIPYPREAALDNIEGEVELLLTIAASGQIKDVKVTKSSNRLFTRVAVNAAQQLNCKPQANDVTVPWTIGFTLK